MPESWAVRFAVRGDLRFASHHDMMRATARAALRAGWPVAYSHGFNPRPVMSLPSPRPVGVSGEDEWLVIEFPESSPGESRDPKQLLERFKDVAPPGLEPLDMRLLPTRKAPQPIRSEWDMPLDESQRPGVETKLAELAGSERWTMTRHGKAGQREIDLRELVSDLRVEGVTLRWAETPDESCVWARPDEIIALLGLDGPRNVARMTRRKVEYRVPEGRTEKNVHENQSQGGCAAPNEQGKEGQRGISPTDMSSEPDEASRRSPPADAHESFHERSKET